MSEQIPINEFDIIFISYDEDNAEENWIDLKMKCRWAKRVHGVYGSDAAHKAAANLSDTERFTTVDADTTIDFDYLAMTLDKNIAEDKKRVISWSSRNSVNGLVYGNGSLKSWTKTFINNMKTHELSDTPKSRIEFCFEDGYTQSNKILSLTFPNGSPRQAFRSGFREGVKMCLEQGVKIPLQDLSAKMYWKNMIRLLVWCSVGANIINGIWCMYGARLGCQMINLTDWDYINVRDFEYINSLWNDEVSPKFESFVSNDMCIKTGYCWDKAKLKKEIELIGDQLRTDLGLSLAELDEQGSEFFRRVFTNPVRVEKGEL